jgi:hypothetical protein
MAKRDDPCCCDLKALHAEVRRRARVSRKAKGRTRALGGGDPRLASLPTPHLVRTLRDRQRAIYGTDDRKDLYHVTQPALQRVADAVAALVKSTDLKQRNDGTFKLSTTSYRAEYDLCGSEPFAAQPLGCFCTGFLVGPDVIATAGHCVTSLASLRRIRFVFGFRMLDPQHARTVFGPDDVYRGAEIIGRRLTEGGADWALVRLDRPVVDRRPLKVRRSGKVANNQKLFVIGHPNGLPAKYADGARVRHNTPTSFFAANLDTYGGNSGSPVFDQATRVVEGILVRGENDFVSNGDCSISLVCPDTGCRGEDVTRSTVWAKKIPPP